MEKPAPFKVKNYIRLMFISAFMIFIANKVWLRPLVLESDGHEYLKVFVLSLPNFLEVVMGSSILVAFLFVFRSNNFPLIKRFSDFRIIGSGMLLAAIFVLTQELKIHNIGGRNVYDFNDLMASAIGVVFMFLIFTTYGFVHQYNDNS